MPRPLRRLAAALVLLLATLFAPAVALANWNNDGNAICTADQDQTFAGGVPDGSGGALIAWLDRRRGFPLVDLYATRILANGDIAPGWPADGAVLAATGSVTQAF